MRIGISTAIGQPQRAGALDYFPPGAVVDYTENDMSALTPSATTIGTGFQDEVGGNTAIRTRSDITDGLHGASIPGTFTPTPAQQYFADLTFKPDGRDWFLIQVSGVGTNAYGVINPATEAVGLVDGAT